VGTNCSGSNNRQSRQNNKNSALISTFHRQQHRQHMYPLAQSHPHDNGPVGLLRYRKILLDW